MILIISIQSIFDCFFNITTSLCSILATSLLDNTSKKKEVKTIMHTIHHHTDEDCSVMMSINYTNERFEKVVVLFG